MEAKECEIKIKEKEKERRGEKGSKRDRETKKNT